MNAVHNVLDAIYSDPLETEIGQAILNATDSSITEEDWTQIMHVCELVNSLQDGPSLAIRTITRRLSPESRPSNTHQLLLTMSVLEALVKNCGRRFHRQLTWRPFIRSVRSAFEPETTAVPVIVQDGLKSMLQSWAIVFQNEPDLRPLCDLYTDLKQRIEFPPEDLVSSPISTNPTQDCGASTKDTPETFGSTTLNVISSLRQRASNAFSSMASSSDTNSQMNQVTTRLRFNKIRSELSIVDEHVRILNEMVSIVTDAEYISDEDKLIMYKLWVTIKQMHHRIVVLVGYIDDPDMVALLLAHLDNINATIFSYSALDSRVKYKEDESLTTSKEESTKTKEEATEKEEDDLMLTE